MVGLWWAYGGTIASHCRLPLQPAGGQSCLHRAQRVGMGARGSYRRKVAVSGVAAVLPPLWLCLTLRFTGQLRSTVHCWSLTATAAGHVARRLQGRRPGSARRRGGREELGRRLAFGPIWSRKRGARDGGGGPLYKRYISGLGYPGPPRCPLAPLQGGTVHGLTAKGHLQKTGNFVWVGKTRGAERGALIPPRGGAAGGPGHCGLRYTKKLTGSVFISI